MNFRYGIPLKVLTVRLKNIKLGSFDILIGRVSYNARWLDQSQRKVRVVNLGSDTFGNPIFLKGLTKLAILLNYKCPELLCLALPPHQILGLILVIKFFFKLKLQKNHFNKKCEPKLLFFNEKKSERFG